jgi:glycogen debranching enzyme
MTQQPAQPPARTPSAHERAAHPPPAGTPPPPTGDFEDFAFRTAEAEPMAIEDIRDALTIHENALCLVTDKSGGVPAGNESGFGLYLKDTRFLSEYEFAFSRIAPVMLLSTAEKGYACEQVLTNPTMQDVHGRELKRSTLEVRRVRALGEVLVETLTVTNFNVEPVTVDFAYRFGADFADIFEVRGQKRARRGTLHPPQAGEGGIRYAYTGLDGRDMETRISFSHQPYFRTAGEVVFRLTLRHREPQSLTLTVTPVMGAEPRRPTVRLQELAHDYKRWKDGFTRVITSNDLFNATLDRSISDLRTLWTHDAEWGESYIAAGTPWFDTLFGRDSLIVSMQTLALTHTIARASLRTLGRLQGTTVDEWRDEEPGKILHELRQGEMARTGESPFSRYYGSVDSTPLYLMLAAEYWRWTADRRLLQELEPVIQAALRWVATYGDRDGDGYVEYEQYSEAGLLNQGWKDSGNAIPDHHGRLARPPIALVEVQAYVYAARMGLARLAEDTGDHQTARTLRLEAAALKRRFQRDFWLAREGTYALALDGSKRQVDSVSSNPGHALWAGIVPAARARQVVERMMRPDMFSGWGVRTLSAQEPAFNPLGYHIGSVWPHDNALLAMGLKRYGFEVELNQLATALFDVAQRFDYYRLPELFCGTERTAQGAPVPYPVACRPQAWAAGAIPMVLTAILGLCPDAPRDHLYVVKPQLPYWLDRVQVRNLRVGAGTVDLLYQLENRRTRVAVLNSTGRLRVTMVNRWPT